MANKENVKLTFFYPALKDFITTDILEIENASNNLIVAPTIGTLLLHLSDDALRPSIAQSWRCDGTRWIFYLRDGFTCENGEVITATGFAKSLARSIRLYSQNTEHPIFGKLKGYKNLLQSTLSSFPGISADQNKLIFDFEEPVTSGFLDHLTMAPFGYIAEANFVGDMWKDRSQIVSSGPYRLDPIEHQNSYILRRRNGWIGDLQPSFPIIEFRRDGIEAFEAFDEAKIIFVSNPPENVLSKFRHIRQVPQNLSIVKANVHSGPFQDINLRRAFFKELRAELSHLSFSSNTFQKTEHFFFGDRSIVKSYEPEPRPLPSPPPSLTMKVMSRAPGTPNHIVRELAEKAAAKLGWTMTFDSNPYESFKEEFSHPKFDLWVQGAEIGVGFESWVIEMLFCSDVGDAWPDPSNRIQKTAKDYREQKISLPEANQLMMDSLIEDAAVMPTFHKSAYYLLGDEISDNIVRPNITRLRLEEISPP